MFDGCKSMAELNEARIEAIRSGNPAILVNKEYAKRKALLMSSESRDFKRVAFFPVPLPELEYQVGTNFAYEKDNTICISTRLMNG